MQSPAGKHCSTKIPCWRARSRTAFPKGGDARGLEPLLATLAEKVIAPAVKANLGGANPWVDRAPACRIVRTQKAHEPLRRVHGAGTHLLGLINEVLDLSKIEAGKLELNPDPVNLPRLIDEVTGTAGQLAEKSKNRLIVEAQENLGALNADSMRLKQILLRVYGRAEPALAVRAFASPHR